MTNKIFVVLAFFLSLTQLMAQLTVDVSNIDLNNDGDYTDLNEGNWRFTYQTGTYDSLENTINSNINNGNIWWWGNSDNAETLANTTNISGLRFPYATGNVAGNDTIFSYATIGQLQVFQSSSGNYVINATQVPAPLPILGIIPIIGFLKKMRRRQLVLN